MTTKILITGGAGFAGHHVVEHVLKNTDWSIVVWDKLNYASNGLYRLRDIQAFDSGRVDVLTVDFTIPISEGVIKETGNVDYIVHMGAETHVDNSIVDAFPFVMSNVVGTYYMLEYARRVDYLERFIYFSTDEVFGPAPPGVAYKEWDRYDSSNPYAATKAGGEELALAYANTYGLPVIVTHTMNLFGERQHPEKFIPLVVNRVLAGEVVTIHADETRQISGSRFYIHCRNMADAVLFLLLNGEQREKYNIVGEKEVSNLDMALFIADTIGKTLLYNMVDFHGARPGHDLRYALDGSKMAAMGWAVPVGFEQSLEKTIQWMLDNQDWMRI